MRRAAHAVNLRFSSLGNLVLGAIQRRGECFAKQRLSTRPVKKYGLACVILPENRRPKKEDARRHHGRAMNPRLSDRTNAPGSILGSTAHLASHLNIPFRRTHTPAPGAKLIKPRCVHKATRPMPECLTPLLNGRAARREQELASKAALVVIQGHQCSSHGFDDIDAHWTGTHLGALGRGAARCEKAMLETTWTHDAKRAVENPEVRIHRHAYSKIVGSIRGIAVVPGSVVEIDIAGRRLRKWLRRLVHWIVVELIQHLIASDSSMTANAQNSRGTIHATFKGFTRPDLFVLAQHRLELLGRTRLNDDAIGAGLEFFQPSLGAGPGITNRRWSP